MKAPEMKMKKMKTMTSDNFELIANKYFASAEEVKVDNFVAKAYYEDSSFIKTLTFKENKFYLSIPLSPTKDITNTIEELLTNHDRS